MNEAAGVDVGTGLRTILRYQKRMQMIKLTKLLRKDGDQQEGKVLFSSPSAAQAAAIHLAAAGNGAKTAALHWCTALGGLENVQRERGLGSQVPLPQHCNSCKIP